MSSPTQTTALDHVDGRLHGVEHVGERKHPAPRAVSTAPAEAPPSLLAPIVVGSGSRRSSRAASVSVPSSVDNVSRVRPLTLRDRRNPKRAGIGLEEDRKRALAGKFQRQSLRVRQRNRVEQARLSRSVRDASRPVAPHVPGLLVGTDSVEALWTGRPRSRRACRSLPTPRRPLRNPCADSREASSATDRCTQFLLQMRRPGRPHHRSASTHARRSSPSKIGRNDSVAPIFAALGQVIVADLSTLPICSQDLQPISSILKASNKLYVPNFD